MNNSQKALQQSCEINKKIAAYIEAELSRIWMANVKELAEALHVALKE